MIVKQVRLSQQAKEQLSRLKGKTGISNWNVLCRWALCLSLAEPMQPPDIEISTDSNVEMSWHVFAGEYHELYSALLVQRCKRDGLDHEPETLARQFKLHLHRGVSYLAASSYVRSIDDLTMLAVRAYGGK
jgi:DNA sulfur modification protein DndE